MGLLDFRNLRKKERIEKGIKEYFEMLNVYNPSFTTFEGGLYEMELTRAAIHSFATHCSKLKPEVKGSGNEQIARILQYKPNPLMDTKKYLYRLATVYMTDNNAIIAPLHDKNMDINGFYPLATNKTRLVKYNGTPFFQYEMTQGNFGAIEVSKAGIMNQFQYRNELFGESNACLYPTMELINTNNQGIIEGVKNSANVRFMAKLANTLKPADIEAERERFTSTNLNKKNNGGILLFDQKYEEIKQITTSQYSIDSKQMDQIRANVFDYFGTNEKILRNEYTSDEWNAYYEGKIEPFAIEASLVHTNMLFSDREIAFGNEVIFTANRLQYLSNEEKLNTVTQLFDRGFITHNEGLEIFNMKGIGPEGDRHFIRLEYAPNITESEENPNANESGEGIQNTSSELGE